MLKFMHMRGLNMENEYYKHHMCVSKKILYKNKIISAFQLHELLKCPIKMLKNTKAKKKRERISWR